MVSRSGATVAALFVLLSFIAAAVEAFNPTFIRYSGQYLLYNPVGDCFVGTATHSLHCQSDLPLVLNRDRDQYLWSLDFGVTCVEQGSKIRLWNAKDSFDLSPNVTDHKVLGSVQMVSKSKGSDANGWKLFNAEETLDGDNYVRTMKRIRLQHVPSNKFLIAANEAKSSTSNWTLLGWNDHNKASDFIFLEPGLYARNVRHQYLGELVKFTWKLNDFSSSNGEKSWREFAIQTPNNKKFTLNVTESVGEYFILYRHCLGTISGNHGWAFWDESEDNEITIRRVITNLPRISNFQLAPQSYKEKELIFQWEVAGSLPQKEIPLFFTSAALNIKVLAKVTDVFSQPREIRVPFMQLNDLWEWRLTESSNEIASAKRAYFIFHSDAGWDSVVVIDLVSVLKSLTFEINYLTGYVDIHFAANETRAILELHLFQSAFVINLQDGMTRIELCKINGLGTEYIHFENYKSFLLYDWPLFTLGGVRKVTLIDAPKDYMLYSSLLTIEIEAIYDLIHPVVIECGGFVLKTIDKIEDCGNVTISVNNCHRQPLTINVEGIKNEILHEKLIVLPKLWHVENMKSELQGKDLKLNWTKPDFCNDVDVVLVKSNLDEKEWNICSASQTVGNFVEKFPRKQDLKFTKPGITFHINHALSSTPFCCNWTELNENQGTLNCSYFKNHIFDSSVKILINGKIVADFATVQSSFLILWIEQPLLDKTSIWQIDIFGNVIDIEPPYKYYSRIENIQMEEKTLWPGDFVSVSWTSAGPVSPKSVSAELRCKDKILNRVENVFNTSRVQVQVHEECKESGILFQSDAGTEMISVSHMKLYELKVLNYKMDYLEGLMEVSWKLNSDEEESNRVTEMNVTLFGVEQQINAKIRTIHLDMTEMDLKLSNQLTFSHSHMKFQYSWPNVKLGGVRQVKLDSLPNEIEANDKLNIHLIMKSELIAPVICKCGDVLLKLLEPENYSNSDIHISVALAECHSKSLTLNVESVETLVLLPLVVLKQEVAKSYEFPWILVAVCSGSIGFLLIIGVILWHCYRVRKRKRQAALLRAFGSGNLHIFHIGEFK